MWQKIKKKLSLWINFHRKIFIHFFEEILFTKNTQLNSNPPLKSSPLPQKFHIINRSPYDLGERKKRWRHFLKRNFHFLKQSQRFDENNLRQSIMELTWILTSDEKSQAGVNNSGLFHSICWHFFSPALMIFTNIFLSTHQFTAVLTILIPLFNAIVNLRNFSLRFRFTSKKNSSAFSLENSKNWQLENLKM